MSTYKMIIIPLEKNLKTIKNTYIHSIKTHSKQNKKYPYFFCAKNK
jgi:hypothetical protein